MSASSEHLIQHSFIHAPASTPGRKTYMFPFPLGWTGIPQTIPKRIANPAHQNPAQARPFWHVQKGVNAATASTPVRNSPTHSPPVPQAGTDRDEDIPCWRHPPSSPGQGLGQHLPPSPACTVLPDPAFHGLSAAGTHPAGSQPKAPSPGCVYLNPHVLLLGDRARRACRCLHGYLLTVAAGGD